MATNTRVGRLSRIKPISDNLNVGFLIVETAISWDKNIQEISKQGFRLARGMYGINYMFHAMEVENHAKSVEFK